MTALQAWALVTLVGGGIGYLVWDVMRRPPTPWFDTHSTRSALAGLLSRPDDPGRARGRLDRLIRRGDAAGAAALAQRMGHHGRQLLGIGHTITQPGTEAHRQRITHVRVEAGQEAVVLDPGQRAVVYDPDAHVARLVPRRRREDGAA